MANMQPEFKSAPHPSIDWLLEEEIRGDDRLRQLIGEREGLFMQHVDRKDDPNYTQPMDRMRELGELITARNAQLDRLEVRAQGNPQLFDLLVRHEDAQAAVENDPQNPDLIEGRDELRAAVDDYEDAIARGGFTT